MVDTNSKLKTEVINGVFWIALAKYSGIVVSLIVVAILSRCISASAFGTVAIALVILHFLNILADIGIGPAIVQYPELNKRDLDELFTVTLYLGVFLAIVLFFTSNFLSSYYNDASLKPVCEWMSIVVFFNALNVVPNSLMRKDKKFKTIAIRTFSFQFFSGLLSIWAALVGWGIYALLISPIITAVGVFCFNFYNYPQRIVLQIKGQALKMVSSYSFFQFCFTFVNYFCRNLDKLIIGKYFSMEKLGYYDKSYHTMLLPVNNISFVIDPVLHPILTSLKDKKSKLGEKNVSLSRIVSYISFPLGIGLFFCAEEIINILYGSNWEPAVPVFRILALSLPLQIILSTNNPIFQAAGKTNLMFYSGLLNSTVSVFGFFIAAIYFKTIEAVAWSWDITLLINFVNTYIILYCLAIKDSPIPFFKSLLPQFVNTTVVFLLLWLLFRNLDFNSYIINLLLKSFMVLIATIGIAVVIKQYKVQDIFSFVRKSLLKHQEH